MTTRTMIAALVLAAGAWAQSVPELRTEATNGGSIFFVKNTGSQAVTAFLIELVNYPGSYYALWQDEGGAGTIAPGAEKRIPVTNMTVGAVPDYVKLTAAVLADGSTAGNPEKVGQLLERRKHVQETVKEVTAQLEKAKASGAAKESTVGELKQWADSLVPQGKPKPTSQAYINEVAARAVVGEAATFLESHTYEEAIARLPK